MCFSMLQKPNNLLYTDAGRAGCLLPSLATAPTGIVLTEMFVFLRCVICSLNFGVESLVLS